MVIAYIRVSTEQQSIDRQIDLLKNSIYGSRIEKYYTEKMSGAKAERPQLDKMLEQLRKDDIIIIESLSRLGRSTKNLIALMERFNDMGVSVISLKENIDTTTPQGKLFFTLFSALAEFERDIIRERTNEGLKSARARGKNGGRPKANKENINIAVKMYESRSYTIDEILSACNISRGTLYKYIKGC